MLRCGQTGHGSRESVSAWRWKGLSFVESFPWGGINQRIYRISVEDDKIFRRDGEGLSIREIDHRISKG